MGWLATIQAWGKAIFSIFSFAQQRDAEKNAPDVKLAAEKAQEQKKVDEINQTVAKGDLAKERELGAE